MNSIKLGTDTVERERIENVVSRWKRFRRREQWGRGRGQSYSIYRDKYREKRKIDGEVKLEKNRFVEMEQKFAFPFFDGRIKVHRPSTRRENAKWKGNSFHSSFRSC